METCPPISENGGGVIAACALGSGDEKLWAYILHFTGKKLGGLPIFHVLGKHAASHRALCARGGAVCSGYGAVGDVLCKRGAGDGEER